MTRTMDLQPGMIQLSKVDLGEMRPDWSAAPCSSSESSLPKKKVYPSLYVDRVNDPIDLPNKGVGKVTFRIRRRETSIGEDGQERHGATIEIQSIETEDSPKGSTKLSALQPGMIHFADSRPRNINGQFEPEQPGGLDPNTMSAAYGHPEVRKSRMTLAQRLRAMLPGAASVP